MKFDGFTDDAVSAITSAQKCAAKAGATEVEPEHLLVGTARSLKGLCLRFGIIPNDLQFEVQQFLGKSTEQSFDDCDGMDLAMSSRTEQFLSKFDSTKGIASLSLLAGLLSDDTTNAKLLLKRRGCDVEGLQRDVGLALAANASNSVSERQYRQGDVVLISLAEVQLFSESKRRPAVVISNDPAMGHVIVSPIIRKTGDLSCKQTIPLLLDSEEGRQAGIRTDSAIDCTVIATIDKVNVCARIGRLPGEVLRRVCEMVRRILEPEADS